jgi:hypothetical protein
VVHVYDLRGKQVGRRTLDALRRDAQTAPVALRCEGARFREPVELEGIAFAELRADGAVFEQGLALRRCSIDGDASLDDVEARRSLRLERVSFAARAFLRRMQLATLQLYSVDFGGYASLDGMSAAQVTVRHARFAFEARLRNVEVSAEATLHGVAFAGIAGFDGSTWRRLRVTHCSFAQAARFDRASVAEELALVACRLSSSRNLELRAGQRCDLHQTTFEQALQLRVRSPQVDARSAGFERGVDLILSPRAELDLGGASLGGPSLVTSSGPALARIVSLRGTRLGQLTLRDLDLSGCAFAQAHAVDGVLISGRGQLACAPVAMPWIGKREALANEFAFRHARELRRRPYGPHRWHRPGTHDPAGDPATLSETYRALRRGREGASDAPGAADFYYGEMEMRRLGARAKVDRLLLTAYWIVSGYGLRASRALLAYALVVPAVALALDRWGLRSGAAFDQVLAYVLATTTVLARPETPLELDTFGSYLQVFSRLVGPALFALMVFSLRSRVRR